MAENVAYLLKSTNIFQNLFTFLIAGKRGGECGSFVSAFTAFVCPLTTLLAKICHDSQKSIKTDLNPQCRNVFCSWEQESMVENVTPRPSLHFSVHRQLSPHQNMSPSTLNYLNLSNPYPPCGHPSIYRFSSIFNV